MVITIVFNSVPVPVEYYGGTERIVYWLMKELVKRNNTVYLIGHKDSKVSSIGVNLIPLDHNIDWRMHIPPKTDIVHTMNQENIYFEIPLLNTVHVNENKTYPINTVFVSKSHAEIHGSKSYVYNGIDLEEYPLVRDCYNNNENYLFLGNGRWDVKNLRDCIKVSVELRKNLYVCGGDIKAGLKFFKKSGLKIIYPFLPNIRYCGVINQEKKLKLMKNIDILLWPVRWQEPFGIAIIEAMSQGIPVYSSSYGSSIELIPTFAGCVCNDYYEFKEKLKNDVKAWNIYEIRSYVENYFSSKIMTSRYLEKYERVISGEKLNDYLPKLIQEIRLLPF